MPKNHIHRELAGRIQELETELEKKRSENRRMDKLLSFMEVGLSLVETDLTIIWVNEKLRQMFPETEPSGRCCHQFLALSPEPCSPCPARRCFESGNVERMERYNVADNRWFAVTCKPIKDLSGRTIRVLLAMTDITEVKQLNAAFDVFLKKIDDERSELKQSIMMNIKEMISPYIEKLKKSQLQGVQRNYLQAVESNLNDICSRFSLNLFLKQSGLSPAELMVASHIRQGGSTKEIASLLNLSPATIRNHRVNVRRKLGLNGEKVNLRSYLLAMK